MTIFLVLNIGLIVGDLFIVSLKEQIIRECVTIRILHLLICCIILGLIDNFLPFLKSVRQIFQALQHCLQQI